MKSVTARTFLMCLTAACLLASAGCQGWDPGWWSWFDPSKAVRTPPRGLVNPIYTQLGPLDQTPELVPNATQPTPEDLVFREEDYVIGPSDVLRISVLDLYQEGLESMMERQVTDSGYIDMPLIAQRVKASGLTQDQLTSELKSLYKQAGILLEPTVSVTVMVSRQNIFSARGAIARAGTYPIPQKKFTLMEALAMAGDVAQTNIDYIYVIRPVVRSAQPSESGLPPLPALPPGTTAPSTTGPAPGTTPTTKGGGTVQDQLRDFERDIPGASFRLRAGRDDRGGAGRPAMLSAMQDVTGAAPSTSSSTPASSPQSLPADLREAAGMDRWVRSDGQWVRLPESAPAGQPTSRPADEQDPYGWRQYDMSQTSRIIAINLPKLNAADPRMNIIINNGDIIQVPTLEIGEFYVMGEVLRPGVYSLTGRRVTLKMAISAAGNLGDLSWPSNTVLTRRVGRDQEQMVSIDLNKVLAGQEPDILLKPDDVIAVGSHWSTPFLAVWRNAFRMTYGFGFIYDRNYSERDFEVPLLSPSSAYRLVRHGVFRGGGS